MRCIIAGDRNIAEQDYQLIDAAILASKFKITEVVSGAAKGGDKLGENWASINRVKVKKFPADWKDLDAVGAVIKEGEYGKYNARAGFDRNTKMVEYCDCVIILSSNNDYSTCDDIIDRAKKRKIPIFIYPERNERISEYCYTF